MKLSAEKLDLRLRHTFTIARSSSDWAQNVLVRLRDGKYEGLGEASPARYYGQTQASCLKTARAMSRIVKDASPFDLERVVDALERRFPKQPSARAAVDLALHDLLGQRAGLPLWKYWGLDPARTRKRPTPSASTRSKRCASSWPRPSASRC